MLKICKKLLLGSSLALALGSTQLAQASPTELTVSVWLPPTHSLVSGFIVPWLAEIEEQTEGRVKTRLLPKAVTNPAGHYDAVRNGLVDISFISHAYYPGRFELTKLLSLPLTGDHGESRSVAAWRIYDKYLMDANEHRGVKLLGIYGHGPGLVHTSHKPVRTIDDFNDLKVRVGGGMAADVAQALGVNPVVKPAPDSYELISTGVVDGLFFPGESLAAFKLDDVVRYITRFPGGLYGDSHALIMNEKTYKQLDDKDRQIIDKLSGEYVARMAGAAWGGADQKSLEAGQAKGVEIIDADDQLIAEVRERTKRFEEAWLEAAKKNKIDGPTVLVDFHEQLKQLDAEIDSRS